MSTPEAEQQQQPPQQQQHDDDNTPRTTPRYPTLLEYGQAILRIADSAVQCQLTYEAVRFFNAGELPVGDQETPVDIPDTPPRREAAQIVDMRDLGPTKKGGNNPLIALIHAQAAVEEWAINLSWDIICRFAGFKCGDGSLLPREFFADWLRVADDECRHFEIWKDELASLGISWPHLPIHQNLWDAALATKDSLLGRLCILHMCAEASGLDHAHRLSQKFHGLKHSRGAKLMMEIQMDETTHVRAGVDWFKHVVAHSPGGIDGETDPIKVFHHVFTLYRHGKPRPPYNHELRAKAGLTPEWYVPLGEIADAAPEQEKLDVKNLMKKMKDKKQQQQNQQSEQPQQDNNTNSTTPEAENVTATTTTTNTTEQAPQ